MSGKSNFEAFELTAHTVETVLEEWAQKTLEEIQKEIGAVKCKEKKDRTQRDTVIMKTSVQILAAMKEANKAKPPVQIICNDPAVSIPLVEDLTDLKEFKCITFVMETVNQFGPK
eukprot:7900186-Heterocapsa_arctica.AAC.1